MVELPANIQGIIPSKASLLGIGSGVMGTITLILLFVLLAGIIGIIVFVVFNNLKYNRKIEIWEKIHNNWELVGKDRALEIKFGNTGDMVLKLKKRKKYLPMPEIQVGRRRYWYAIREDGEWINIGMGDIDLQMKQAKAKFLHTEMRAFRTAFQSNLNQRLNQPKFMEKYGTFVIGIITLVICGLILWFLADKIVSSLDKINSLTNTQNLLMEKASQVISGIDNICSGSGYRPI